MYEKIVMLDYDLLVLQNFDELFDEEELSGVPMLYKDEKIVFWEDPHGDYEQVWSDLKKVENAQVGVTGLNSGVVVLKPNITTFNGLVDSASKLKERPCCPSQELIYRYFSIRKQYRRLPPIYNLRKIHLLSHEEQQHYRRTCKIYHFVEKTKPIVLGLQNSKRDYFASLWWNHAIEVDKILMDADQSLVRTIKLEAIRSALK